MFFKCALVLPSQGGCNWKVALKGECFLPSTMFELQSDQPSLPVCGEVAEQYDPSSRFHMWKYKSHRGRLLAQSCRVFFLFFFLVDIICLYQSVGMCIWWNRCIDNFLFKLQSVDFAHLHARVLSFFKIKEKKKIL